MTIISSHTPAFVEVHAENYMGAGGTRQAQLTRIRERARYRPAVFFEHLAWSTHDGRFFNDLLPLCYDEATLRRVCDHIDRIQERLGLRLLLENPSS